MRKILYLKEAKKRLNILSIISTDPNLSTGMTHLLKSTKIVPVLTFHSQCPLISMKIVSCLSVFLSIFLSAKFEETAFENVDRIAQHS